MNKNTNQKKYTKQLTFMGAGCGIVLFMIFGLLPGSFIGGVMGINLVGILLGIPVTSGVLARILIGAFMVIGVMVSGIMFLMATSTAGWLTGSVIDALLEEKKDVSIVKQAEIEKDKEEGS